LHSARLGARVANIPWGPGIKQRFYFKGMAVAPVECLEKNDMGEFLQILKPGNKFRPDFNAAPDTPYPAGLDGYAGNIRKRRINDSNRVISERFGIIFLTLA